MKYDSDYRSLTPKDGWPSKPCERCGAQFWLAPGQFNNIRYCKDECRYGTVEQRIEWHTVKGQGPKGECWNCTLTPSAPYPQIRIDGKMLKVSRVVLEKQLGRPLAEKMEACHHCDNPKCILIDHIFEGTHEQNMRGCAERRRLSDRKGAKCPTAKLTEDQARDIKFNPLGLMGKDLAAKYGVSRSRITMIQQGKQWTDLQP